jgi:pimeloyl-ACP methyl ester carboxylesterase
LKLAGYKPIAFMLFNMMGPFRAGMKLYSRVICSDPRFPAMMDRDLSRTTVESFLLSIASLRRTDLTPMLQQVKVPAMGIYGDKDVIVHPAGHFPMLEEPNEFIAKLKSFLDQPPPTA